MEKQNKIITVIVVFMLSIFAGCTTYEIMPNHDYNNILKNTPLTEEPLNLPSLEGKTIVLEIKADYTTQPVGAYCNDHDSQVAVTPVVNSYVISQPGYGFFEYISDNLKKQKATVFRRYFNTTTKMKEIPAKAVEISININTFQYHMYSEEKKNQISNYHLSSVDLFYSINGEPQKELALRAKTLGEIDPFDILAQMFIDQVVSNL